MEKLLIEKWEFELSEPPCAPGSGRYGVKICLPDDISAVFPYLNAVLEDTVYDHANEVLIGKDKQRLYAFRPREIQVSGIEEAMQAPGVVKNTIEMVNQVWRERSAITPRFTERKIPTVMDVYRLLPKTNCRRCGYATCLVFAADLRLQKCRVELCPVLNQPEFESRQVAIHRMLPQEGQ